MRERESARALEIARESARERECERERGDELNGMLPHLVPQVNFNSGR